MNNLLIKQVEEIIKEEDFIAAVSNVSAVINSSLKDLNWCGFYFVKNNELVLGPFQGKVACTHIPFSKGVCGACYTSKKAIRVADVHEFAGHIACDSASNSELVVPIIKNEEVVALIDLDSPLINRFTQDDEDTLVEIAKLLTSKF